MRALLSTIAWRRLLPLMVIPLAFMVIALVAPARQYHWDTLERAYLVEHPGRFLRTWDGTPRSQFLSFAHVLELPLAAVVRAVAPGMSGLRALCVLEAIAGAVFLVLLGWLVQRWRGQWHNGNARDALVAAWAAQATLAVSGGFWRMGSSGEEKILAMMTQAAFLAAFWRSFWDASPESQPSTRDASKRFDWAVVVTLVLAILSHLTGAVLVPFAAVAIALLPQSLHALRPRLVRSVVAGTAIALVLYWIVAAATTHAFSPRQFYDYLTFFHRADGIDFFIPADAPLGGAERVEAVFDGIAAFFTGPEWAEHVALWGLAMAIAVSRAWWRRQGRGRTGDPAPGALARTLLQRHVLLLVVLWTAHFAYFEPANHESWTLLATLAVLLAAVALPGRTAAALAVLPVILFVANRETYAAVRRPLPYAEYADVVTRETREGDVILLVGGVQDGKALRGSLGMRYFLGAGPQREYVSLYDLMGITQPDYWPRPFATAAELQRAIDGGRNAFTPSFMRKEIENANASGLVRIETAPASEGLLRIMLIESPGRQATP